MMLSAYPKYRDSGVDWIGKVPDHWEIASLGSLLKERKEKNSPIKTHDILSLSMSRGVIPYADKDPGGNKAKDDLTAYMLAYPGDIVVNSMNVIMGAVGLSNYFGAVSPVYYMLYPRIKADNVEYFNEIFHHKIFQLSLFGLGNGILVIKSNTAADKFNTIRMRIPMSKLKRVQLPYPKKEEQESITLYLKYINIKIQKYISAKRKLIKLLEEQKQAIIHQAVTGAFDVKTNKPYEGYKATKIPWVNKIPKHWNTHRLRTISTMLVSNVDKHTLENEQSVRLCNYVDVYKNERITEDLEFMKASATQDEINNFKLQINDVLVTKDSEIWTDIGVPSLVCHEANDLLCGYHLAIIRPKKQIHGEYLLRLLQDKFIATQMHVSANGVTRYGLSHGDIKNVTIPIPSTDEQILIADFLNKYNENTSLTIKKYTKEIELIQEYKTSIIANVVTGKVDVRKAANTLSEELEVVDELDDSEEEIIEEVSEVDENESN